MKKLFAKLYHWCTEPLYKRLARENALELQKISQAYLEEHERLTSRMIDELISLRKRVDELESASKKVR